MTRPAESPDKQNARKFARRIDPGTRQLRRAADRSYAQLLDELRTFVDPESPSPERTSSQGTSRSGQNLPQAEPKSVGRRIAKSIAWILTAISLLSFLSGYLVANYQLDVPFFQPLWEFGRSLLTGTQLRFLRIFAPVVAWIGWAVVVARGRRLNARARRRSAESPASVGGGGTVRRSLREMKPYSWSIALLFLVSLSVVPLTILTPLPIKLIVDNVAGSQPFPAYLSILVPDPSQVSKEYVIALALGLLLGGTILSYLQNLVSIWLTNRIGNRMTTDMRVRLFRQMQRLSTVYHDTMGTTDSTYRIQNDATSLRSLSTDGLIPLMTAVLTLGGMMLVMVRLDWQLALIALSVTPFMFLFTLVYKRRIRLGWRKVKSSESAAMSAAQESLSAARVVKAFGQEERENEEFRSRYTETASAALKVLVEGGVYSMLVGVVTAIGLAAVLYVGIQHVLAGTLTLGALLMVNYYLTQLYSPLKDMGKKVLDVQMALAGMERFLEILSEQPDVPEKRGARWLDRAVGTIAFHDVSFGYDPGRLILRRVSFHIAPGMCLGVIGPTGSGKTTLSSLILRFFDPTEGVITLDDVDLKDYRIADLRNQFGVVLQDTLLFSTTIAENIAFAKPEATINEIVQAAKLAGAHEFIRRLPDGYDAEVGERGMKLSGGERQRISLARAFLKDAPILILDEPTSSLDVHTEATVLDAIQRLMKGRTTLMIAHRASTLRTCNSILILEPGGMSRVTDEVESSLQSLTAVGPADWRPTVLDGGTD